MGKIQPPQHFKVNVPFLIPNLDSKDFSVIDGLGPNSPRGLPLWTGGMQLGATSLNREESNVEYNPKGLFHHQIGQACLISQRRQVLTSNGSTFLVESNRTLNNPDMDTGVIFLPLR
jgi:hypothetical protein